MSKVLKNVLYVTAAVLFGQILGSSRSFLLAKLLVPSDYGIWTGVQTIVSLAPIACLGTVEALMKRVPYYRGKGDAEGLQRIENSVFATVLIAAGAVALVFLLAYRILPIKFIHENLVATQVIAASAAVGFFTAYYYYRSTAYEDFRLVSVFDSMRSVSAFVCILCFAWKWGLLGAVVGCLVSELVNWAIISSVSCKNHGDVYPDFRPRFMAEAVQIGFPITVIWWVYGIHTSVGRMTAVSYLGNTATGYYGVATSIAMLFALVPNMVGRVFYPRINAQVGGAAELEALRSSVVRPTSAITLLMPLAQLVVVFLLPIGYQLFLPKYKDAVVCSQILIFGSFFVGMIRNGANYLIAINMQMRVLKYVVVSVLANTICSILFVKLGFGIDGLAVATSLASSLFALFIWRRVFIELAYDRKSRVALYASFYLPFVASLLAAIAVRFAFGKVVSDTGYKPWLEMVLVLMICMGANLCLKTNRCQLKELAVQCASVIKYFWLKLAVLKLTAKS